MARRPPPQFADSEMRLVVFSLPGALSQGRLATNDPDSVPAGHYVVLLRGEGAKAIFERQGFVILTPQAR